MADMKAPRTTRHLRVGAAAMSVAVAVGGAGRASSATAARGPLLQLSRARALVDTFDRVLVAGFLAGHVSERGRDLDINDETSRSFA